MQAFKLTDEYVIVVLTPDLCEWISEYIPQTLWGYREGKQYFYKNVKEDSTNQFGTITTKRYLRTPQAKFDTFDSMLSDDVALIGDDAKNYLLTYVLVDPETALKYVESIEVYDIQDKDIPTYNLRDTYKYHV